MKRVLLLFAVLALYGYMQNRLPVFSRQDLSNAAQGIPTSLSPSNTGASGAGTVTDKTGPLESSGFKPGKSSRENNRGEGKIASEIWVYPNPFADRLTIIMPQKGNFELSIFSADGKQVYHNKRNFSSGEILRLQTTQFSQGIYLLHISSTELHFDHKVKLIK